MNREKTMKLGWMILALTLVGCAGAPKKKMDDKSEAKKEMKKEMTKENKKAEMKPEEKKPEEEKTETTEQSEVKSMKVAGNSVTCSYGENTRTLENKTLETGGCEVIYTKDGVPSTIANAQNEMDYCQEVLERVAGKLANAGFNCNQ